MANDTFAGIAGKLRLRCSAAPVTLSQDWVQSAFRDIVELRRWSWLLKRGQLYTFDAYTTGTATISVGTQTVTLNAPGVVSPLHIGRQFRVGTTSQIVTITGADVALNTYTIDQVWFPSNTVAQPFTVYQAYVALPSDFHAFVSVIDPLYPQSIPYGISVAEIDKEDPQRAMYGTNPRGLAYFDYFNGLPRYELWPHNRTAAIYPIVYESRPTDPFDVGATVPALLPSDVILERALMYCAAWPGDDRQNPNPYFSKDLISLHQKQYDRRIAILTKQDNEHMQQNIWYQSQQGSNGGLSASWMQSHDNS